MKKHGNQANIHNKKAQHVSPYNKDSYAKASKLNIIKTKNIDILYNNNYCKCSKLLY